MNEALHTGMVSTPYMQENNLGTFFTIFIHIRVGGVHQSRSEKRSSKVCSLSDQSSKSALMLSERIQNALQVNVFNGAAQPKNSEDLQV